MNYLTATILALATLWGAALFWEIYTTLKLEKTLIATGKMTKAKLREAYRAYKEECKVYQLGGAPYKEFLQNYSKIHIKD